MNITDQTPRYLIAAGVTLFLLGLITGFAIPALANPRMGLSGHLEGVMNGTFLIAIGAVWSKMTLSALLQRVTFWLLIYGTYANWLFVNLAAMFGTGEMTPIAGAGYTGLPWQENLVTLGLSSVGVTMLAGCTILAWGFIRRNERNPRDA